MEETRVSLVEKIKNRNKLTIANDIILAITIIGAFVSVILIAIYTSMNGPFITSDIILDIFMAFLLATLSVCGVISVVASNNKAPIMLLAFSMISTLFKLMYPIIQISSGVDDGINATVLVGQTVTFFLIIVQVYLWLRWNKETDEGKFITESFKGSRLIYALITIVIIIFIQVGISYHFNEGDWKAISIDIVGGILYTFGSVLMAFGNILCFGFFLLSDLNWMYYTIKDMIGRESGLMFVMALMTMLQVIAYTALAITGFIQWFIDDFKFENGKIVNKNRGKNNTQIKEQE